MPRGDKVAVLVEDLHAVVAAVGNVNAILGTSDGDVVRLIELARPRAVMAPGLDELAVFRKFQNAIVLAVAICHKDVAIGRDGDARRLVEGIRAIALDSLLAERHQNLARRT